MFNSFIYLSIYLSTSLPTNLSFVVAFYLVRSTGFTLAPYFDIDTVFLAYIGLLACLSFDLFMHVRICVRACQFSVLFVYKTLCICFRVHTNDTN